MDNTKQPQRILSLCTGMRGLERGIERAGVDLAVASYVEIEAFIIWNLVKQMEQGVLAPAPVYSNLKTFPWQQFHGRIHGIIGGYPCQPFSCAGSRKGTEDPRHLWPYIKEGIHAVRPLWCFFENVPGHLTLGYEEVRNDLCEFGYSVKEGIYSAEEVGAPHQRKRLFIIAVKMDNSNRNGHKSEHEISTRRSRPELASKELGDTTDIRCGEFCQDRGAIKENQNGEKCRLYESSGTGSLSELQSQQKELADTDNTGSQRWDSAELPECSGEFTIKKIGSCERWPARPGEEQYEWEPSRIKPRLGFMLNGYSFREDLLRMAGNGVVEQTAELAWIDLWNKIQPTTNK